jgi:hypothetical protein
MKNKEDMSPRAKCAQSKHIDIEGYIEDSRTVTEPSGDRTIHIDGLGNFLVEYFTTIGLYSLYGKDVVINKEYYGPHVDFVEKLPSYIPYNAECQRRLLQIPDIHRKLDSSYHRISDWSYNRGLLKPMIPFIQDTFKSIIPLRNSQCDVVIHFRCADTPRNRHGDYMFQRFKWYIRAIQEASKRLHKPQEELSVIILSCS